MTSELNFHVQYFRILSWLYVEFCQEFNLMKYAEVFCFGFKCWGGRKYRKLTIRVTEYCRIIF